MSRRVFLECLVGWFLAGPLAAEAQQAEKTLAIGYLSPAAPRNPLDDVFERSLEALGWVEGRNIRIERRYSGGRTDTLPPLATELAGLNVDVFVAWSPPGALAAKRAASQRPVVFLAVGDPIAFGLVSNLARPSGNVTGISFDAALEMYPKGLQLLAEAVPALRRVALLAASGARTEVGRQMMMTAAKELNLELQEVVVASAAELEVAVRSARDQGAQALYIWPSGLTLLSGTHLAALALSFRLPSIHPFREGAVAGGLLSYAPSLTDIAKRGARYVDRILRGAKPGDLPIEQPTKFELVINLKTANALGLTLPQSLLLRADQVIE
jgi:putative ABC transport system substrate-binding protein